MRLRKGMFFLLLAGALAACKQEVQVDSEVSPAITEKLFDNEIDGTQVVPTSTVSKEDIIQIDKEHFSSEVFRNYIAQNYDLNQDGYLSKSERMSVTSICFDHYEEKFENEVLEVLDGFENFPNLVDLEVGCAEKVILRNHLSLASFWGGEGCNIGTLMIDNCPKLESVGFFNCWIDTLSITNVSAMQLSFSEMINIKHWILDGDIALDIETSNHATFVCTESEQEKYLYFETLEEFISYLSDVGVQWINLAKEATLLSETEMKEYLLNCNFDFFDFEIEEIQEGSADITETQGWNIAIDYEEAEYKSITFPLYTESEPKPDAFFVRPKEIREVCVMRYSPNRGTCSKVKFNLEFVYCTEQEEVVLGEKERTYYVILKPDGTSKVYRPWYDDEARQADW